MITTTSNLNEQQIKSSTYDRLTVYGKGHHLFAASSTSSGTLSSRTVVILNDLTQTLSLQATLNNEKTENLESDPGSTGLIPIGTTVNVKENNENNENNSGIRSKDSTNIMISIDGWTSHFSPLIFTVAAECVWVLSPTVSKGQLGVLNSQDLRNRIAVVLRGNTSCVISFISYMSYYVCYIMYVM